MGINQWTRVRFSPDSAFCQNFKTDTGEYLDPGEYLFMYKQSSGELLFKDQKKNKIYTKKTMSIMDLVMLLPDRSEAEIMRELKRKGRPAGEEGYSNHHIIPVHLWNNSKLVIAARMDMNGDFNLMRLPNDFHRRNHGRNSNYSNIVRHYLEKRWNDLVVAGLENDPGEVKDALLSLIDALRDALQELVNAPDGYIGNI
jgi:hypothetical protein